MTGSEGNDSWIRDMRVTLLSPIHLTYVLKLEADFEADKVGGFTIRHATHAVIIT